MNRPIVLAAVSWTLGVVWVLNELTVWAAAVIAAIILLAAWITAMMDRFAGPEHFGRTRRLVYVMMVSFLISLAYNSWVDHQHQTMISEHDVQRWGDKAVTAEGWIASRIEVDGDRARFTFRLRRLGFDDRVLAFPDSVWRHETVQVSIRLHSEAEQNDIRKWNRGDEVVLQGNLQKPGVARNFGAFDYREYLRRKGIHWELAADGLSGSGLAMRHELSNSHITKQMAARLLSTVDRWREKWASQIDLIYSPDQRGWMKSMTIGIRDDLDAGQFEQFSMIGISHILAISGLHVGIFVGAALAVLTWTTIRREHRYAVVIALIPPYILLTGAAPSVLRAGMMAMIALYAHRKGWLKDGMQIVAGTGWLMLMWNPYYLLDIGFQLSFAVTIGLIVWVPRWKRLIPVKPNALSNAIAVTSVAQIVSFPLTVYYFHHVSLLSWLANLLLVPVISMIIIPGTIIAVIASGMSLAAGRWLAGLIEAVNRFVLEAVHVLNRIDPLYLHWPEPPLWWVGAVFALIGSGWIGLEWMYKVRSRPNVPIVVHPGRIGHIVHRYRHEWPVWWVGLSLMLLAGLVFYSYAPYGWTAKGEVHFIDVGQGDAIFIRTPGDKTMLVDAGGTFHFHQDESSWRLRRDPFEVGKDVIVPLLKRRGVQQLDYVVITHHDYDHIGGLPAILERVPVKRIIFNGTLKETDTVKDIFRIALQQGIPLHAVHAGDSVQLDPHTEWRILFPHPQHAIESERTVYWSDRQNEHSLVSILSMHGYTFLLTGDIEEHGERLILDSLSRDGMAAADGTASPDPDQRLEPDGGIAAPVDVMKVAHHGSKTSTSDRWLYLFRPRVSVISAGPFNRYGHPHADVLDRLMRYGSEVYRTDRHGEVQFRVMSDRLDVRTKLRYNEDDKN